MLCLISTDIYVYLQYQSKVWTHLQSVSLLSFFSKTLKHTVYNRLVIDRFISWPILAANFSVFYVNWHRPMPAAAFANPALFTDRLHRQLCVAGDGAVQKLTAQQASAAGFDMIRNWRMCLDLVRLSWKYIHRFELPRSITHKWNFVKTQTTALSYRSKEDNELQPYVNQNERLDINSGLYGQPSVRRGRRDRLQSATPKRDTTKNIQ